MSVPFTVDLKGKVAVVTGGSGILCGRMADALGECGAQVAVLGRNPDKLAGAVQRIEKAGGKAMALAADILDRESLVAANQAIVDQFGPADILINGAGGNDPGATTTRERLSPGDLENDELSTFFDLGRGGFENVFGVNFIGAFLATQVFAKDMAANGSGVVINISSMSALLPLTKIPAYSAAKAALSNFTQWLAVHFAPCNVRVNAISPGFFITDQNRALLTRPDGAVTARGETIIGHTPLGRFGQPDDLLGVLLWLVNDQAAGFVTGAVIPVDGGFSAFSGV